MILSIFTVGLTLGIITAIFFVAIIISALMEKELIAGIITSLLFITLIGIMIICGITSCIPVSNESIITDSYDIRAISSSNSLSGDMSGGIFVISGYINSDSVFKCYIKEDDQTYSLLTLPADKTKIIITDDIPKVEILDITTKCQWLIFEIHKPSVREYKIYIPENDLSTDIYLS